MHPSLFTALQITSVLKLLRLITFQKYIYNLAEIYNLNTLVLKTLTLFIIMTLYFHLVCCCFLFLYTLNDMHTQSVKQQLSAVT